MTLHPHKLRGRVWLLHGFNVSDGGERTVQALAPFFEAEGYEVKRFRYGWRGLLGVRMMNDTFARILADIIEPGDIVLGHSNGGCIGYLAAAEHAAPIGQLVLINPALDADVKFPAQLRAVHIWHSPSDRPVAVAKLLPWHNWGDMGAVGYRGPHDPRVRSYNKENGYPVSSREHSDVFTEPRLSYFGPLIAQAVSAHEPLGANGQFSPECRHAPKPPVGVGGAGGIDHPV